MGDEREHPLDPQLEEPRQDERPEDHLEAPANAEAPSYEVPAVLQMQDERELLLRLAEDDPFEVRARVARRLRERALILPSTRLVLNTMARMSIVAKSYDGTYPVEEWVDLAVDVSIDSMADAQREEERRGLPVPRSVDAEFYEELADVFGCPVLDARMACVALNGMSEWHRLAFHAVVVQGMELAAAAEHLDLRPKRVHDLLREVGLEVQSLLVRRRKARRRKRL